jgi:hypothetical protein
MVLVATAGRPFGKRGGGRGVRASSGDGRTPARPKPVLPRKTGLVPPRPTSSRLSSVRIVAAGFSLRSLSRRETMVPEAQRRVGRG